MNLSIRALGGTAVVALALGFAAHADEMRLPQTSEEHEAMARAYEGKAAAWRGEAAYHREMAAAYKKSHPDPDIKGIHNDDATKMEKHCMAIVKHVEKLVAAAEVAAKHHHLRAKELQEQKGSSSRN